MTALLGHTERQPAAVLVGWREGVQPRLILTVRTDQLPSHAGQVAFPGGRSDPADGGDAVTTALRESEEEIGLERALVTPLGFLDCFETISGYCITPVVARVAAEARLYPAPQEVAEVFEVPLEFLMNPAHHEVRAWDPPQSPAEAPAGGPGRRMFYAMPWTDPHTGKSYFIWGATAGMIRNLYRLLIA